MNYQKIYNQLIDRARNRSLEGYKESHHIIPKCIGGTNEKTNLVNLTAREHFIAHQLLNKIYNNSSLILACIRMMYDNHKEKRTKYSSKEYDYLRQQHSKYLKSRNKFNNKALENLSEKQNILPKYYRAFVVLGLENKISYSEILNFLITKKFNIAQSSLQGIHKTNKNNLSSLINSDEHEEILQLISTLPKKRDNIKFYNQFLCKSLITEDLLKLVIVYLNEGLEIKKILKFFNETLLINIKITHLKRYFSRWNDFIFSNISQNEINSIRMNYSILFE